MEAFLNLEASNLYRNKKVPKKWLKGQQRMTGSLMEVKWPSFALLSLKG